MNSKYYKILGIPENSSKREIKLAYNKLILNCHPDKTNNVDIDHFLSIQEAYEKITNNENNNLSDKIRNRFDGTIKDVLNYYDEEDDLVRDLIMCNIFDLCAKINAAIYDKFNHIPVYNGQDIGKQIKYTYVFMKNKQLHPKKYSFTENNVQYTIYS